MAKYRINHEKAIRHSNEMEELADSMKAKINLLVELQNDVRKHWIGEASGAYQAQLRQLISDLRKIQSEMSDIAGDIAYIANTIQREDERIARMAQNRLS